MVALSYYQTIQGYPSGGGSYIVARANLGVLPGLVAAAALMIDYVLNAAVSLTAGVAAVASAFPLLWPYRVLLALALLLVITLVNLRGLRESGTFMAVPVYLFLVTYLSMLVYGLVRLVIRRSNTGRFISSAGNRTADVNPGSACLFNRMYCPDGYRGHQQWRPGFQASSTQECRPDFNCNGFVNGSAISG